MSGGNALDVVFATARKEGRTVLLPYVTGGFPEPDRFVDVAVSTLEAGADVLEVGIPFSDPLLDGPAIQYSQQVALNAGVTPLDCLRYVREIRARSAKPLLFMGAYNPVLAYGVERFSQAAAEAGVSGLIVPDVPVEEQIDLQRAAQAAGIHLIQMIAPTSTGERIRRACECASGFIYCISVSGVTGARASVADTARPLVERVKACSDVPVAVGFGISGPAQAREVATFADGVIVGAAFITLLRDTPPEDRETEVRRFIGSLRDAMQVQTPSA